MLPTRIRDFIMKNLDLISKRILVISLSISAMLLSASLLIFSARPVNAQSPSFSSRMDDGRRYDAVASSNTAGNPYFLVWNTQTGTYKITYCSSTTNPFAETPFSAITSSSDTSSEKFW